MGTHLRSNLIAYLALFIALGGSGAFAAQGLKKDTIKSKHIVDGGVKTKDIADGAVSEAKLAAGTVPPFTIADGSISGAKIADGSITGAKVADDSITGADVDESTLMGVDATSVAGMQIRKIDFQVPFGTGPRTVLEYPGIFRITANCQTSGDVLDITLFGSVNGSIVSVTATDNSSADDRTANPDRDIASRSDTVLQAGEFLEIDSTSESFAIENATVQFATPGGFASTTNLSAYLTGGGNTACGLTGVSVAG